MGVHMNILVIGGSRGIGLHVVQQTLQDGHSVTVLARRPTALTLHHENLRVMKGDVLDPDSVRTAIMGQTAVVFTVGIQQTLDPVTVFSEGTMNVLSAMKEEGIKLLIAVTGIGSGNSKGPWGLLYKTMFHLFSIKTIYDDKDRQEQLIKESDTDWIIVRPAFLTDGPLTGRYRALKRLPLPRPGRISRADVAHFIVEQLKNPSWLHQAPLLMY
jgi:putative NADH-flavin reductase